MPKPVNLEVRVRPNEPIERAIKRFTRKVKKEKIMEEYLSKQRYEKPSSIKNRKKRLVERKRKQELLEQKELERSIISGTNYRRKKKKDHSKVRR